MKNERQRKTFFAQIGILFFVALAIAALWNPASINSKTGLDNDDLKASDAATSIVYDKMLYEWTGVTGIYGLGSFGSSGRVWYYHQSGNSFLVDYYDAYNGEASYNVNNATRLITSASVLWNNVHDFVWMFSNITLSDTVLIRNPWTFTDQPFNVTSEANYTAAGVVYLCWYLTGPQNSVAYYAKAFGLLIYGEFRNVFAGYTYFTRYTLARSNAPNDSPPALFDGQVTPTSGNTTTVFRYSVNYTDPDNHDPEVVNVIIDGKVHAMSKETPADTNYTDGVIYYYQTPLTNTSHSFFFNASDWKFAAATGVISGPYPVLKLTDSPPVLTFIDLYPTVGHMNINFRFRVNFTDVDNDIPVYVNVTINGTILPMSKLDPNDDNYINGVIYQRFHEFSAPGNYSFQFNASDGTNAVGTPAIPIQGPRVWAPYPASSLLFNGAYMNYSGTYLGILSWSGNVNYTYISGNNYRGYHYNSLLGSSTLTVNNCTRYFTATSDLWSTSGYDWVWIFKNISITDIVPIAMSQESYRNFTVTGEATRNRLGKTFNCWILRDQLGSVAYYDKNLGLFIEGSFVTSDDLPYTMYITDTNIPNVSPPVLRDGMVTPTLGDMATTYTFQVNYTDSDNNHPTYVHVIINNVTYSMTKLNAGDTNYTDGCIYKYSTTLQNISYSFRFEASDGGFKARYPGSGTLPGPIVMRSNLNPATLGNEYLRPKYVTQWDTYYFRITYTDVDNIGPSYVNLIVAKDGSPYGTFPMVQENPADQNFLDGANFIVFLQFGLGDYSYYFESNDSKFVTIYPSAGSFNDLIITPARTPIFDGLYYNYYIGMYMGYWGEGSVSFTMVNATAVNCSEVRTMHIGGALTTRSWAIVDIRSRKILSSSSSTDVGRQDSNTIWNNTRVGTITNMKSESISYGYYPCVGSGNITAMSRSFDCWKFEVGASQMYFEKSTGMFIYSYYNVGMGYSITKTITATNMVFGVNDKPVATGGGAINNTLIPMNHTGDTIDWTITDTNGGSGTYRVLINGSQYIGWTSWTSGSVFHVPVDTNRGIGVFNYTLQYQDIYSAFGNESHVYVPVYDIPVSNHPPDSIVVQNSTGITIDWILTDIVGTGDYRVTRNGSTIEGWTGWVNDTAINIAVDTSIGFGTWNYTIEYNNSRHVFGAPDIVLITVNDIPVAALLTGINNTEIGRNVTGQAIPWVINDIIGAGGTCNVSINGSYYTSVIWSAGIPFSVIIDTDRGLGWFNYTLQYSDSNGARGLDSHVFVRIVKIPMSNHPADLVFLQNATIGNITWILTDDDGPGHYRVLRNGIVQVVWTPWVNESSIDVIVDTSVAPGFWNYTIQFNNSAGKFGIQDVVIATIEDHPFVVQQPGSIEVVQNSTRTITWVLFDCIGAGTFTLYINGVAHPTYTNVAWLNNTGINIVVDTNAGLGTFNYTLRFYDIHGFEGQASTVMISVISSGDGGTEDPFLAFLREYWIYLLAGIAGLIAIIAVVSARRKKKTVPAKKSARSVQDVGKIGSKQGPGSNKAGDTLANSLVAGKTAVQSSAKETEPGTGAVARAGMEQPATTPRQQPAKFFCTACQKYYDIQDPDFVTWYSCPACKALLDHVVACPVCNNLIALHKDDHAKFKSTGVQCSSCNSAVKF